MNHDSSSPHFGYYGIFFAEVPMVDDVRYYVAFTAMHCFQLCNNIVFNDKDDKKKTGVTNHIPPILHS